MMELSKRVEELLEEYNLSLCGDITERYDEKGKYDIELETYSPKGENFIVSFIYDGTEEDFVKEFIDFVNDFDEEEHAAMWIQYRGTRGVPESINDLLIDAGWIKNMLLKVADRLSNLDENSEEFESMNREQFYTYILENFNVNEQTGRLIDNILQFVESNYLGKSEQYNALCSLLCGTIGLTDDEIKRVRM